MVTLITAIFGLLGTVAGWYFGKSHQAKVAARERLAEREQFKRVLASHDLEAIRKIFADL